MKVVQDNADIMHDLQCGALSVDDPKGVQMFELVGHQTKAFKAWYRTVGHTLVKFDQCRLGQLVEKATTINVGMVSGATILHINFQKTCNPRT